MINEHRQDELQTRLLRELIDTVVRTSKDEIREDRANVEKSITGSKTVNELGIVGDELKALKETVQAGSISQIQIDEFRQNAGYRARKWSDFALSAGGAFASGDLSGAAALGGRGLLSVMGGMSTGAVAGLLGGASILGIIATSYRDWETDRKSTRLNSSHSAKSRMPSSA